jgi:hypothetical protein
LCSCSTSGSFKKPATWWGDPLVAEPSSRVIVSEHRKLKIKLTLQQDDEKMRYVLEKHVDAEVFMNKKRR